MNGRDVDGRFSEYIASTLSCDKTTRACDANQRLAINEERHEFAERLWKDMEYLQHGSRGQICGNTTAWRNAEIMIEFLDFPFAFRFQL